MVLDSEGGNGPRRPVAVKELPDFYVHLNKSIFQIIYDDKRHLPVLVFERVEYRHLETYGERKFRKRPKIRQSQDDKSIKTVNKQLITRRNLDYHLGHMAAWGNYPDPEASQTNGMTNTILQHRHCKSWTKLESWIRDVVLQDSQEYRCADIISAPICYSNAKRITDKRETFYIPDTIMKIVGFTLTSSIQIWYLFNVPNEGVDKASHAFMADFNEINDITINPEIHPDMIVTPCCDNTEEIKECYCSESFRAVLIEWINSGQYTGIDCNGEVKIFLSPTPKAFGPVCNDVFGAHDFLQVAGNKFEIRKVPSPSHWPGSVITPAYHLGAVLLRI